MKKFVLKRFLQMFLVWILVSIFSFSIIYFAPGDPLYIYMTPGATGHKMTDEEMDRMRESLGLNGNVVEQYVSWAENWCTEIWVFPSTISSRFWTRFWKNCPVLWD